jgi:hypothetical protein
LIGEFVQNPHGIVNEPAAQVSIGGQPADQGFHVPVRHARRQCGLRSCSSAGERTRTVSPKLLIGRTILRFDSYRFISIGD